MGMRNPGRGNGGGAWENDMEGSEMERGTEGWREWGPEQIRADLNRRTDEAEIDRRHQWGRYAPSYEAEERRPRGAPILEAEQPEGAPPGRYGYGAGPGVAPGWRRRWSYGPDLPPPGVPQRGGFGGAGGGPYGGAYGGMGPGPAGAYPPAGEPGGLSGTGSLSGGFGHTAGWPREPWAEGRPWRRGRYGYGYGKRPWTREGPLVRDLMTRDPRVVGPEAPVEDAARLMREEDAGIIPVCLEGRVLGVVTDRDLTVRVLAEGRDPRTTRVSEVMSGDVQVCTPEDRLIDAIRIMGEENVRRLPVVDRNDRILGILSMTDVAREAEVDYALQEALDRVASRRSFWSRW